jgi:hypothetical protein
VNSNIMSELLSTSIMRAEGLGLAFGESIRLQASPELESIISRI